MLNSSSSPPRLPRLFGLALLAVLVGAASLFGQLQTGNIFGTVVDSTGEPLPGVTVTLTGGGAPRVFVTDNQGQFRFLSLSPGSYNVQAELEGVGVARRDNVRVTIGASPDIRMTLATAALAETITVTAETPLLDVRRTGTGATITEVELEQVPTARDPWVILQQTPGVLMDRINVGGNESGQQSQFVGKGVSGDQASFNVDGVTITDMAATGSSPTYYDFDAFEEMQVTTGGTDPRIHSPGVQLNMVTKRGTNEWSGGGRFFWTDNEFQEDATVPEEARGYLQRANEISRIEDYGLEAGGPIIRDRLWFWGAYGRNDIDLITAQSVGGAVLPIDKTTLENWNAKLNAQLTTNNSAVFLYTLGDKVKTGRNVGPTRPPETAWNQQGPTDLYKLEDTHIFSPNFYSTFLASYVGGGFELIPAGGLDVDNVYLDQNRIWHNSFYYYYTDRPQTMGRADAATFFETGALNHELKFGFGYRETPVTSVSGWPGDRWGFLFDDSFGLAFLYRPGAADYEMQYIDLYAGDTILMNNWTFQVGLRADLQEGFNNPGTARANVLVPDLLPSVTTTGDEESLEWSSISPRIGATYSMGTARRTLIRGAYNRYADQLGAGPLFGANPVGAYQYLLYYWNDDNMDRTIQREEILFDEGLLGWYNLDPDNPGAAQPLGRYDSDMDAPSTDEFILGAEHELMPNFVIGGNYTYRIISDVLWEQPEKGFLGSGDFYTSADYEPAGVATGTLPDGTPYSQQYFRLREGVAPPIYSVVTNRPGYEQTYNGIELNATKRMSNRWMMRANVSFNDWEQQVDPNGFIDPTPLLASYGCSNCNNEIVVQGSGTGSGAKGGVYINSRWAYNLTGVVELPFGINFGANLTGREGYPIPYFHHVSARDVGDDTGAKSVLVAGVAPRRNEDIMNLDLRLAKQFDLGPVGLTISADAFNVTDERTIMQRSHRLTSNSRPFAGANRINELQSPRVIRFGARLSF